MNQHAFFPLPAELDTAGNLPTERQEGAWRVVPIEGAFEIVYEDSRGLWSTRFLDARELKLGPGRTLIGGIDRARGGYRGFRADRIRRLTSGPERVETGILDWLLGRAEAQRRERLTRRRKMKGAARAA
jgi:predicted DNA-binding transcriptional regulator YafY